MTAKRDPNAPQGADREAESDLDELALPEPRPAPERRTADGTLVAPDPVEGDLIGGYRLGTTLGKGGAGSVFKAVRISDGAVFAMKVLSASKVKRARVVQRFFDEVRAAGAVAHPGLIRVYDFIEEESPRRLAYVMEYVDGEALRSRLKRKGALDLRTAIHVGIEICEALTALHDRGIVHRDLKPENILLIPGVASDLPRVKLLDFGVVKFLPVDKTTGGRGDEKVGTFVGTPRYMAPEQAAGASVDGRADLFAVGVVLFEMITGRCPHEGDSLRDVVLAKLEGAPRITVNPEKEILPAELTEAVDACLQLKPALRPKDARRVASVLRDAEVVLFAVGPIKAQDAGGFMREGSVAPSPPPPPKARPPEPPPPAPPAVPSPPRPPPGPTQAVEAPRSVLRAAMVMVALIAAAVAIAATARVLMHEDEVLLLPTERRAQPVAGSTRTSTRS